MSHSLAFDDIGNNVITVDINSINYILHLCATEPLLKAVFETYHNEIFRHKITIEPSQGYIIDNLISNVWSQELKKALNDIFLFGFFVIHYEKENFGNNIQHLIPRRIEPNCLTIKFSIDNIGKRKYHAYYCKDRDSGEYVILKNSTVFVRDEPSPDGTINSITSTTIKYILDLQHLLSDTLTSVMNMSYPRISISKKSTKTDLNDQSALHINSEIADNSNLNADNSFDVERYYNLTETNYNSSNYPNKKHKIYHEKDIFIPPARSTNQYFFEQLRQYPLTQFHNRNVLFPPTILDVDEHLTPLPLSSMPQNVAQLCEILADRILLPFDLNYTFLSGHNQRNTGAISMYDSMRKRIEKRVMGIQNFFVQCLKEMYHFCYEKRENEKRELLKKDAIVMEIELSITFSFNYLPLVSNWDGVKDLYTLGLLDAESFARYAYRIFDIDNDSNLDPKKFSPKEKNIRMSNKGQGKLCYIYHVHLVTV